MPSPRPMAPSRSAVLAFTLTWPDFRPRSAERLATIAGMCGAILGASAWMVASRLAIAYPAPRTFAATSRSSARLSASLYFGSVSGKCRPMSPSPAAPRSASHTAWTRTSASECPARPFSKGMSTPPMISLRPRENALGDIKIRRKGDFQIPRAALDESRLAAERLDRSGLVGDVRRVAQGFQQQAVTEHLRRLRLPQMVAGLRLQYPILLVGALQGIGDRNRQDAPDLVAAGAVDETPQLRPPEAGPCRVVHQHPVVRVDRARAGDEPVQNALAPARAAAVERRDALAERTPVVLAELRVADREHHEHDFHLGCREQPLDRVEEHGSSREERVLLGLGDSEARSGAGGRDEAEVPRSH